MEIFREITPLNQSDCFMIFSREKEHFDFPLHTHHEIELNLIMNAKGTKRIVGDHIGNIDNIELVLVGSDIPHGWFDDKCTSSNIREITIQFHANLFDEQFLCRNQMINLRNMLNDSKCGILFSTATAKEIAPRIVALFDNRGFRSLLDLMQILNDLSLTTGNQLLANPAFNQDTFSSDSRRIERVFEYMNQHFGEQITLSDVAKIANMSDASFSRFIKKHTGYNFIDSLNNIRVGHVARLLIDTNQTVSEIAFKCGFNNMANFNRLFRKKKEITPSEFRRTYMPQKIYV